MIMKMQKSLHYDLNDEVVQRLNFTECSWNNI